MARMHTARKPTGRGKPFWRIGLYIRLSKEDENEDESQSVINQEKILRDFVEEYFDAGTYTIADVFADDGLSGTDTRRPEFQRLEGCIARKEINCMIIKALARGFRNLGDQQKFLEEFIPVHGARFINLSSPFIDTYLEPRSCMGLEVPIRGMFNEQFAASTSEEVRKTFQMKRERGEFIGAFAPYGYSKDASNKNKLVVDEDAAGVVRSIFGWFVQGGYSKKGIAQTLNQMGLPNPATYKKKQGLSYQNPNSGINDGLWSAATVSKILRNEMYTGTMVQGKFRVINYKVHTQINVPPEEWFVVPNTHEAIIDKKTFEKAQLLHRQDTRVPPGRKTLHLFSGLIRCPDCGKAMTRKSARSIVYYTCRTHRDKKSCTSHSVREDQLYNIVLNTLQRQIALCPALPEAVEQIHAAPALHQESTQVQKMLKQADKRRDRLRDAADGAYIDWKSGELTEQEYRRLKQRLSREASQIEENTLYLRRKIRMAGDGEGENDPYLASFLKHQNIQSLSRGILLELIDTIQIHYGGGVTIKLRAADQLQASL